MGQGGTSAFYSLSEPLSIRINGHHKGSAHRPPLGYGLTATLWRVSGLFPPGVSLLHGLPRRPLRRVPRRRFPRGARRARGRVLHARCVEGRAPAALVVAHELEIVALFAGRNSEGERRLLLLEPFVPEEVERPCAEVAPQLLADHSQLVQIAEPNLSPATLSSRGSRSPRPQREDKDAGDEKRGRHGHASSYWSFLPRSVTRSRNAPISRLRKSTSAG